MKLYRIGQLSKLFDISVDTLRHYEKLGILKPEIVKESGYRYYSNRQIWRLATVRRLRTIDVSLEEIAEYMNQRTLEKGFAFSELNLERVQQKIRDLKDLERLMKEKIRDVRAVMTEAENTDIRLCELPERKVWQSDKAALNYWDIDRQHQELESEISAESTEEYITRLYRRGAAISSKDFQKGRFDRYSSSFIVHPNGKQVISGGQFLCLYYWGHENIDDIAPKHQQIQAYMQQHGWEIAGPVLEVYLLDLHEVDDPSEFLTEIQVPVKPMAG
ncbi:MerR family transcriptional regulator [Aliagarivorans marinus]|uniref:MerR family transcriptional regulator n=1 Tax=Aliagarivorans marinus TaxID=561965 RepID=UPI000414CB3D|nr:MerR family transcriptional regulator [Aliagarivorans marinus]